MRRPNADTTIGLTRQQGGTMNHHPGPQPTPQPYPGNGFGQAPPEQPRYGAPGQQPQYPTPGQPPKYGAAGPQAPQYQAPGQPQPHQSAPSGPPNFPPGGPYGQPSGQFPGQQPLHFAPPTPPKKRKTGLIVALVAALILAGSGIAGLVYYLNDGGAPVDNSAFLAASTPEDRLSAALNQSVEAGTVHVKSSMGGDTIEGAIDYRGGAAVMSIRDSDTATGTIFMRGKDILMRVDTDEDGMKANVWYRMPSAMSAAALSLFGKEQILSPLDSAENIVESGKEQINGVNASKFVVDVDPMAMLESMSDVLGEDFDMEEMGSVVSESLPSTFTYWIDDAGMLVRMSTSSDQVMDYFDYGKKVDLPSVNESEILEMPGF